MDVSPLLQSFSQTEGCLTLNLGYLTIFQNQYKGVDMNKITLDSANTQVKAYEYEGISQGLAQMNSETRPRVLLKCSLLFVLQNLILER